MRSNVYQYVRYTYKIAIINYIYIYKIKGKNDSKNTV